jgi:hypothetical protein
VATKKPNEKNTKAEILQAYEDLAKEKSALKSQLEQLQKEKISITATKEKPTPEIKPAMNNSASVQQKMNYTIESLAKIQLGFGSAVSELSEQLSKEAANLQELRQQVTSILEELKALHGLEVAEDTLTNLIKAYKDNSQTYQEEFNQRSETVLQALQEQKLAWEKEQEEHKKAITERNETLKKTHQRDEYEYKYDLELRRKLETDEYEQQQKALYKQLADLEEETKKQWEQREKTIAEREKQFTEAKAKVEAFPKEKEAAIKKATGEGEGIARYQAKVKADLYAKEVEGQKRFYEQRLQSLEATIDNQQERIQSISKQLESALKQVQDLAVKAIEGASNSKSYQAIQEIALEQAKNQGKNK